jgi:2-oxo-3-hexenedioate decarboxylase
MNLNEMAFELRRAEKACTAISSLKVAQPEFTIADAYSVQRLGLEIALSEGNAISGYKMGLTSIAKQRDVGVFEPIHGYLLRKSEYLKGATLDRSVFIHPRVEPEVAVVMKSRLRGPGVTLRDVKNAIAHIIPALEILDSRFENFSFKLEDVIADNTSASGFMLGSSELTHDNSLRLVGVSIRKNGVILETGAPAAVLGDPLLSVVALANSLGKDEKEIEAGMVILTGGITASVPFDSQDVIEVVWPNETMTFRVS